MTCVSEWCRLGLLWFLKHAHLHHATHSTTLPPAGVQSVHLSHVELIAQLHTDFIINKGYIVISCISPCFFYHDAWLYLTLFYSIMCAYYMCIHLVFIFLFVCLFFGLVVVFNVLLWMYSPWYYSFPYIVVMSYPCTLVLLIKMFEENTYKTKQIKTEIMNTYNNEYMIQCCADTTVWVFSARFGNIRFLLDGHKMGSKAHFQSLLGFQWGSYSYFPTTWGRHRHKYIWITVFMHI